MTAKERIAKSNIRRYEDSTMRVLRDAYPTRYSHKKEKAFEYCKNLMKKKDGFNLKIVSANTHIFTAGFQFFNEDGDMMYMHITPSADTAVIYQ